MVIFALFFLKLYKHSNSKERNGYLKSQDCTNTFISMSMFIEIFGAEWTELILFSNFLTLEVLKLQLALILICKI